MEIHHPHDRFFRSLFSNPDRLRGLLEAAVSPEILALLNLDSLTVEPGTWIDDKNREHFSDIAASVAMKFPQGTPGTPSRVRVYVLVEHKSYDDPTALLQLLRYMVQAWSLETRSSRPPNPHRHDRNQRRPLTPIIPILVYHGPDGTTPGSFADLFPDEIPEPLMRYQVSFGADILDLPRASKDDLGSDPVGRAALWMLRTVRRSIDERLLALEEVLRGAEETLSRSGYDTLARYLYETSELSIETISDKIRVLIHQDRIREGLLTTAEQLIKRGEERGEKRGRREGESRGNHEARVAMARQMLADGLDIETIIRYTRLSREELRSLETERK